MAIENLQPLCYAVITVAFIIGLASTFLRLYSRYFILKIFGWDDAVALLLLIVNAGQQAILYLFLHFGCGLHVSLLSSDQIQNIVIMLTVDEVFYMFTHWTIKQAFLMFYLRLSRGRRFRQIVFATMGLNFAFMVINWMLAFFQCIPFDAIIHKAAHPNAKCIPGLATLFVPSVLNMIADLIILTIPIVTLWDLQLSRRRKIGVLAIVGFGASAVIIAACRLIILYQLHVNPDISYVLGRMIIVAALEIEFAIVAVNLPSMKALWNKMTGETGGGSGDASGAYNLSSFNRRTGQKYKPSTKPSAAQVSVSGARHGEQFNGSEESLFDHVDQIKVTTQVEVTMSDKSLNESLPDVYGTPLSSKE